jgi:anti-sigma B factor antagonist
MLCKEGMDFELTKRQKEGIWILDLRGRLVTGNSGAILRNAIVAMTGDSALRVILNLSEVSEIDADGLGALVCCYARVVRLNGALKLLNLSRSHLKAMVSAKLATVFEVFSDEQDAVNSFFSDRAVRHYDVLDWIRNRGIHPAPDSSK